ncbi:SoxR reducing system RseC family protein [Parahaliea maris]|uniref:SoxR reducing system RseC family protein n=1 Tax=Parahaliea maris TaxID=2716870 RepID=A0A5C9A768_9GAMM|nr:SoxR reducing system RseC family protein [Parahaliea maris]TXS95510.1 SoxR reducing system RseC family protein [Parahaliea maris]
MLLESGEVVAVEADAVWVETLRKSTCGTCSAQKGCGHGLLNRLGSGRRHYIRVLAGELDPGQCRVGDTVDFALPESVLLRGSLIVYLLPLLAMLAGALIASALWPGSPDLAGPGGAAAGFALGFMAVRLHARQHADDPDMQPTLVARHNAPAAHVAAIEVT